MILREAEKTLRNLVAGGLRKLLMQLESRTALSSQLADCLDGGMRLSVAVC